MWSFLNREELLIRFFRTIHLDAVNNYIFRFLAWTRWCDATRPWINVTAQCFKKVEKKKRKKNKKVKQKGVSAFVQSDWFPRYKTLPSLAVISSRARLLRIGFTALPKHTARVSYVFFACIIRFSVRCTCIHTYTIHAYVRVTLCGEDKERFVGNNSDDSRIHDGEAR